jgi:hypothetical protein
MMWRPVREKRNYHVGLHNLLQWAGTSPETDMSWLWFKEQAEAKFYRLVFCKNGTYAAKIASLVFAIVCTDAFHHSRTSGRAPREGKRTTLRYGTRTRTRTGWYLTFASPAPALAIAMKLSCIYVVMF